ncbi:hypothetical protein [Actinomyces faecalis]|nr:hypothetical protein [Actinomyces faecalis]
MPLLGRFGVAQTKAIAQPASRPVMIFGAVPIIIPSVEADALP